MCYAVTLSKTKKKGREHKESIVNAIRQAAENYNAAYVFTFENMRNLKFKEFREQLKSTSRYLLFFSFFFLVCAEVLSVILRCEIFYFCGFWFMELGKSLLKMSLG